MKLLQKLTIGFAAFSLGLGAVSLSINNSQAVEAAQTLLDTIDFTAKTTGSTDYVSAWNYGSNASVKGGANNNADWAYVKLGAKSKNLKNPNYVQYKGAIAKAVSKVTVSIIDGSLGSTGMSVTSWGLEVYSDDAFTTKVDTVAGGAITKTAATFDFVPTSGSAWAANLYYRVSWTIANTSGTNGVVVCDKIMFYEGSSDPALAVTGAAEVVVGAPITYTSDIEGVTWALEDVSPAGCATISGATVTAVSAGTATLAATKTGYAKTTKALTITDLSVSLDKTTLALAPGTSGVLVTATANHFTPTGFAWSKTDPSDCISLSSTSGASITVSPTSNEGDATVSLTATDGTYSRSASLAVSVLSTVEYTLASNTTSYKDLTADLFKTYIDGADDLTVGSTVTIVRVGASPNTSDIMLGKSGSEGQFDLTLPTGQYAHKVEVVGYAGEGNALSVNTAEQTLTASSATYTYYPFSNYLLFHSDQRIWLTSIKIYAVNGTPSTALRYGTLFLDKTSAGCAAGNVSSSVWSELSDIYTLADADIQTAIKAGTGDNDLGKALARYDVIQAKYGYTDFLSRNPGDASLFASGLGNEAVALIAIISGMTLLAGLGIWLFTAHYKKQR